MNSLNPWYSLYSLAPPPFPFCGNMQNGFITDPADTYSSVVYVIVAIIIYFKSRSNEPTIQQHFYKIPLLITVGSVLFHMSFTYILLMADFVGIFILSFYCVAMNLLRLGKIQTGHFYKKVYSIGMLYTFLMIFNYDIFHSGFLMIPPLGYTAYLEYKCYQKNPDTIYKNFYLAIMFAFFGYLFMLFEGSPFRIGCTGTHYYLHTIWHILSAICFYYLFMYYQQFNLTYKNKHED